VNKKKKLYSK